MSRRYEHDEPEYRRPVDLGPLFEAPSVPVDTSEEAAAVIRPSASQIRDRVYSHLLACGVFGATEREIEGALALGGNTVRPRLWELEGNAPAGKRPPPRQITKTLTKRAGMRVYVALSQALALR